MWMMMRLPGRNSTVITVIIQKRFANQKRERETQRKPEKHRQCTRAEKGNCGQRQRQRRDGHTHTHRERVSPTRSADVQLPVLSDAQVQPKPKPEPKPEPKPNSQVDCEREREGYKNFRVQHDDEKCDNENNARHTQPTLRRCRSPTPPAATDVQDTTPCGT